jgi:DNA polymerase
MRTLEVIRDEVKSCTKCSLHASRTNTVFSRGNPEAALCFVGEAPGEDEDLAASPFVGRSGKLLDETLSSLGLDPTKDIYVCNIIKCRPPGNRRPEESEVNSCISYLEEQLDITNPPVIVTLGATATNELVNTTFGITKIRGQIFRCSLPILYKRKTVVIPTYHPSYVLRNGGKGPVFDDFKKDLESAVNKSRE